MEHQTKRVCKFPHCNKPIPNHWGKKTGQYCHTHAKIRNDWSHQLPFGVLSAKYQQMLAEAV